MAWFQLVIGILVLVSPWALGMGEAVITWTNGVLGVLLILTALWMIFVHRQHRDNGVIHNS